MVGATVLVNEQDKRHLLYGGSSTEGTMDLAVFDAEANTKSTRTVVVTV